MDADHGQSTIWNYWSFVLTVLLFIRRNTIVFQDLLNHRRNFVLALLTTKVLLTATRPGSWHWKNIRMNKASWDMSVTSHDSLRHTNCAFLNIHFKFCFSVHTSMVIERLLSETAWNCAFTSSHMFLSMLNKMLAICCMHSLPTQTSEYGFLCFTIVHATVRAASFLALFKNCPPCMYSVKRLIVA